MSKYSTGEIAKLCSVTVRTVQYYDTRGILIPSELSEGGRRLYSEDDLKRMKIICFLRELDLPLGAIAQILKEEHPEMDPASEDGRKAMLLKLQDEFNSYRKGGKNFGAFPERWLPAAICVLPEPFTEKNHMVNSTMKIVRGKVEKAYEDRMRFAYTPEGKDICNNLNINSL